MGIQPGQVGIFVRTLAEVPCALAGRALAGLPNYELGELVDTNRDEVSIGTMHLTKRLKLRAVAVMECHKNIVLPRNRLSTAVHESDLNEVYENKGHLLCMACTPTRDRLLINAAGPPSEFLDDLA
jgi:superfamily I DNA/RNA helicase